MKKAKSYLIVMMLVFTCLASYAGSNQSSFEVIDHSELMTARVDLSTLDCGLIRLTIEEASCTVEVEVKVGFWIFSSRIKVTATAETCEEAWGMIEEVLKAKK